MLRQSLYDTKKRDGHDGRGEDGMDVFVARQPIFDVNMKAIAYELLFRAGNVATFAAEDGDKATLDVITGGFLLIGMEKLTGGRRAFINFTRNLLKSDVTTLLPNTMVVVEILEDVEPDAEVVAICKKLKEKGFTLALDDFVFSPKYRPLIQLADIVKVDFLLTKGDERRKVIEQIRSSNIKFLAEKVETDQDFKQAVKLGYSYFQGYFFSKPVVVAGKDIPTNKIHYLQVLQQLHQPAVDFAKMEDIIKRDASFSYKLFLFINSASFGMRSKISSIRQALVLLGEKEIVRWMSMLALREMGHDKPDELMVHCTVRARMGELLAGPTGMKERASDLFLMGMFSAMDALVDRPLPELLADLPLQDDIKDALLGEEGKLKDIYDLILYYERGEWDDFSIMAAKLGVPSTSVPDIYIEAVEWAREFLPGT